MFFAKNSHCHLIVCVLMLLLVSTKVAAQNTGLKLNQSKIELSSQLARIEAAQHEQAHLLRCLLAGDTDKALCLGTVTYGTKTRPARSCADLLRRRKDSSSGYYWVKPIQSANAVYYVYCDMANYGGGWTLVVGINGLTQQHLESGSVGTRCRGGDVCVIHRTSGIIPVRKLDDRIIRVLADDEGTFRIDVGQNSYTTFFQLPQGATLFQSNCQGSGCPRIITSHYYPYKWESNCKGITVGYHIYNDNYKVFDNHDNEECGSLWQSSRYNSKRVLYGYTHGGNTGIYPNKQGFMYVR